MEPIQVEFTFDRNSFGNAQIQVLLRYLRNGWLKWIFLAGLVCWFTVKLYFGRLDAQAVVRLVTPMAIFVLIWGVIFGWLSRRNFSKFPNLQHPIRYEFRESDIHLVTHTTDGIVQWEAYQKAVETKTSFLLYQNAFAANPVLKSGFKNENDLERFREMLRSKKLM